MKTLFATPRRVPALAAACALAASGTLLAQQDSQDQAQREMNIMRNIFGAALQADSGQNRMRMAPPEALYLAGQGMVFTFHLDGSGMLLGPQIRILTNKLSELATPAAPATPAPPAAYTDGDFDFDYDFDFDFDFDDGYAYGFSTREQSDAYREQLREVSEALREKQNELRDLQREMRDVQREMRDVQRKRSDEERDRAEIARLNATIDERRQELQSQSASMRQLQEEYQSERLAAFEALRTQQTGLIFGTLCDYGSTLRSLASGQHINLVLRNYANDQSQIFVLDYADVDDCSSAETLRQAAISYLQPAEGAGF